MLLFLYIAFIAQHKIWILENKPKKQKDSFQKGKQAFIIGFKMVSLTFSKVTLCPKVDSAGNAN